MPCVYVCAFAYVVPSWHLTRVFHWGCFSFTRAVDLLSLSPPLPPSRSRALPLSLSLSFSLALGLPPVVHVLACIAAPYHVNRLPTDCPTPAGILLSSPRLLPPRTCCAPGCTSERVEGYGKLPLQGALRHYCMSCSIDSVTAAGLTLQQTL